MKIVSVVGARPQFVKAAVLSRVIKERTDGSITEILVHTGQHYDQNMSEFFFEQMSISRPSYSLNISGGTHGRMTGRMLEKMDHVLEEENPDVVVVFGDTNSTLAGALSAAKMNIPVAHVEAGLRSWNRRMPEEVNRILTDQISRWLFCPSQAAVSNLVREGFDARQIINVGDVMFDAVLYYQQFLIPSPSARVIVDSFPQGFCLCTVHRAGTTDSSLVLSEVVAALREVSCETPIVLPLHPRTRKTIRDAAFTLDGITVVEPLSYFDMLYLLQKCKYVLTDSGGLQKEAFFCAKPCLTLRDETEWVELVELGANILGGTSRASIMAAWRGLPDLVSEFSATPYGDGNAGKQILSHILRG
jgi:UDP-GlcNAc3NAcA epimerase